MTLRDTRDTSLHITVYARACTPISEKVSLPSLKTWRLRNDMRKLPENETRKAQEFTTLL